MKDKFIIGIFIVIVSIVILADIGIFNMVVNADIPDWLKYLILG